MKRLGVLLGAGAVTILLGVLAATQAQQNRTDGLAAADDSPSAAQASQPPSPITRDEDAAVETAPAEVALAGHLDVPASSQGYPPAQSSLDEQAVRLVQHLEDTDQANQTPRPAASMPSMESAGPTLHLPAQPGRDAAPGSDAAGPGFGAAGPGFDAPGFDAAAPGASGPAFDAPSFDAPALESSMPSTTPASDSGTPAAMVGPASSAESVSATAPKKLNADGPGLGGPAMSMTLPAGGNELSTAADSAQKDISVDASLNTETGAASMMADGHQPGDGSEMGVPRAESDMPELNFEQGPTNLLRESIDPSQDLAGSRPADISGNLQQSGPEPTQPGTSINFAPAPSRSGGFPQAASELPNADRPSLPVQSYGQQTPSEEPLSQGSGQPSSLSNSSLQTQPHSSLPSSQPTLSAQAANLAAPELQGFGAGAAIGGEEMLDPNAAIDSPGDRRLEGAQTPSIVIQKRAPSEVQVGKPASFVVHVQNIGTVEALDVRVHDSVPAGMRLVDASPQPVMQGGQMLWQLGTLGAGDERTITVQLVPEREGELGSVARVTFEAAASVRTVSTRPELKIVQRVPEQVMIGGQLEIELEVSNPGTGDATGVVLQEDVPEGLEHPKGRQLDNLLGTLRPGETRREILRLRAVQPGTIRNVVRLVGEDGLTAEHAVDIEVVAPDLQVDLSGPNRRFLERQATFQIDIANLGTADADNVEIAAHLDRGFTFVSTDPATQGTYDPTQHAVFWSMEQLRAHEQGSVPLTLLPIEEGEQAIRLEIRGDLDEGGSVERTVAVEALAELTFQIADAADPIELGAETTYEIRVSNSGSRADTNVHVQLQLPPGMQRVSTESDAQEDGQGGIFFDPRKQLDPGDQLVYRVKVRGVQPGRHLIKATVISDQSDVEVTKEESTMVYADR